MKIQKRYLWPAVAVGFLLFGLTLFFFVVAPERSAAKEAEASAPQTGRAEDILLRCGFQPTERLAFTVSEISRYRVDPLALLPDNAAGSASASEDTKQMSAQLLLQSVPAKSGKSGERNAVLQAAFRKVSIAVGDAPADPDLSAALNVPVFLKIDDRCRFGGISTQADLPPAAIREWQLLLSMLEMVMPKEPTAKVWQTVQSDPTGTFVASYRTASVQDGIRIERKRTRYTEVRSGNPDVRLRAEIRRSKTAAIFDPATRYYQRIDSREHIKVATESGRTFADVDTTMQLAAAAIDSRDAFWTAAATYDGASFRKISDLAKDTTSAAMNGAPIAGIENLTLTEVLAQFSALLSSSNQMNDALRLMIQYLRLSKERITALMDALRRGDVRDELHAPLFLALQLTGGPAARDALISAGNDKTLSQSDRLRAVAALQDTATPDAQTVTALQEMKRAGQSSQTPESRAALLAMGTLSSNPDLDENERIRLKETLDRALDDARDAADAVNALSAAGNAKQPSFEASARKYLDHEDGNVRASAIETLQKIGTPIRPAEALNALDTEQSPRARRMLGESLVASASDADDAEIQRAAEALESPDCPVQSREYLIRFLGENAASSAVAKQALIARFPRESDKQLLILIGRFVDAASL